MGGQLEMCITPLLDALNDTRRQWINIQSALDTDRALMSDIKNRMRGALGVTSTLTGLQGEAFDHAMEQYQANALVAEQTLRDIISQISTSAGNMLSAAQEADGNVGSWFAHVAEAILGDLVAEVRIEEMILYGEEEAYRAAAARMQGFLAGIEQAVLSDVEYAYREITRAVAWVAGEVQRNWQVLNTAIADACGVLSRGLGLVEALEPMIESLLKDTRIGQDLKDLGERIPVAGELLTLGGIVLDWGSDPKRNLFSLASDAVGGLLAVGVDATVVGVLTLMQFGSMVASTSQNIMANTLAAPKGLLHQSLEQLSRNWDTTARNLDLGHVLDDWGAVAVDEAALDGSTLLNLVAPQLVSQRTVSHWQATLTKDSGAAFVDSGRLAVGVYQFEVNAKATIVSDTVALSNFTVQQAPFPRAFKSAYAQSSATTVQNMTDVSNLITNGQLPKNAPPAYKAEVFAETTAMAFMPW